jgi:ketosteroid isomerase-like protein
MRKWIITGLFTVCTAIAVLGQQSSSAEQPARELVNKYLQARIQTMQGDAKESDIDKALAFCTDDVVYEHPAAKAKTEGKPKLKQGMAGYLGETKDASFRLGRVLANKNVVMAEVKMKFLAKEEDGSWKSGGRNNLTVFEIEDGKIKRILDY